MKSDKRMLKDAVSPVIGVMMMLVVTIIIAAVVSGFAGGLFNDPKKTPQASISAEFSQSKGLTITHTGGDALDNRWTKLFIRPTYMVTGKEALSYQINYTYLKNVNNCSWYCEGIVLPQPCYFNYFYPGDIIRVDYSNLKTLQVRPDGTNDYTGPFGIGNPTKIGSSFDIEVYDALNSKMIAKTSVLITP